MNLRIFCLCFCLLVAGGCAMTRTNPHMELMSEREYEEVIDTYSDKKQLYDGFYAVMEVSSTIINSKVVHAQLQQSARIYHWTQDQMTVEKSKVEQKIAKETEVFISFFVPDRKQDDLAKKKTLWKIFLDTSGRRYEGKATKMKTILADVTSMYPRHSRWGTPYRITFPVPVSMVENSNAKFTITGPPGSLSLEFKPAQ